MDFNNPPAFSHPYVKSLLKKYDIPTSNRSCYLSTLWNGRNLALYTSDDGVLVPLGVFDILHEIAHWVVATPAEREFPEYGLKISYLQGASGRDWSRIKSEKERDFALRESQGVLTHEENEFREICADFLGCYWSTEEAGLEIPHNFWPHMKYTDRARRQHVTDAIDWLIDNSLVPPDAFKKARSSRCHQEERRCFTSSFGEKLFGMPFDQGRSRGDRKRCRRCVPRRRNIEDRLISV